MLFYCFFVYIIGDSIAFFKCSRMTEENNFAFCILQLICVMLERATRSDSIPFLASNCEKGRWICFSKDGGIVLGIYLR